jgi:glycine cleavage system H protein
MSKDPTQDRCPILPPGEQKCLWMTAGILGYQLCDRSFDCERCPLDAALRARFGHGEPVGPRVAVGEDPAAATGALTDDRRYSRGHCWVRAADGPEAEARRCRVGLEPGLAGAMLRPRSIVLPAPGEELTKGQVHLWIVTDGGTFVVTAPVSGTVRRVNTRLAERPSLATSAAMEEGWLYEVELAQPLGEVGLLEAAAASHRFQARQRRFQAEIVRSMGAEAGGVGATLPDGGELVGSVAEMLGARRYFELLSKVFG